MRESSGRMGGLGKPLCLWNHILNKKKNNEVTVDVGKKCWAMGKKANETQISVCNFAEKNEPKWFLKGHVNLNNEVQGIQSLWSVLTCQQSTQ